MKALDVESSKVIDLETFVPRGDLDPVYFDSSYYLYPDGPIAVETLRVIGAAMAEAGVVGLGRLTLNRRERMVVVEPRGTGMALFTLRAAEEVRATQFGIAEGEVDAEMVAIAKALVTQRTGAFDPTTYRDRYQEALRELIEAKMKGLTRQTQGDRRPVTRDRSDGRLEAQPGAGSIRFEAHRPEEGEKDGTRSTPAGSLAARPRGSETESTGRHRAHHSRRKPAQAGLMPTLASRPNARVINRATAICARLHRAISRWRSGPQG